MFNTESRRKCFLMLEMNVDMNEYGLTGFPSLFDVPREFIISKQKKYL